MTLVLITFQVTNKLISGKEGQELGLDGRGLETESTRTKEQLFNPNQICLYGLEEMC